VAVFVSERQLVRGEMMMPVLYAIFF
jgi:hypothetical protein